MSGLQRIDHARGFLQRHDWIFGAVKGPDGESLQCGGLRALRGGDVGDSTAAAGRDERRETLRMAQTETPDAETAHAHSGQVNASGVDLRVAPEILEERQQGGFVPDLVVGTL